MHKLKSLHINKTSNERLYKSITPIIGLTGSIATGKSTVTDILKAKGLQIIDADKLVKSIYSKKETLIFFETNYPQVIQQNEILFPKLRELFFSDQEVKKNVENFIYTHLPQAFDEAKSKLDLSCADFIIYDVPLLFEKSLEGFLDKTITVYCPESIQIERLLSRDKIDKELAQKIIKSQISIEVKAQKSDFIIDNSKDISHLESNVLKLLKLLTE